MSVQADRTRVIIEGVKPQVDGGRFPIKRTVGEQIVVEADIFVEGHDEPFALLCHGRDGEPFRETPMLPLGNDRWRAAFTVFEPGVYHYRVVAWADRFLNWRRDLVKRLKAGQQEEVSVELQVAARLIEAASLRAAGPDADQLKSWLRILSGESSVESKARRLLEDDVRALMLRHADRSLAVTYDHNLRVQVDRERARFSAWYELFPRSCGPAGRHGTFRDVAARLPYVAGMGFDVLYLPPIHPIGRTFRKGKNNAVVAQPDDVGSPWGIGAAEGGHKAIHPDLGTLDDFRFLVAQARQHGVEIALDVALQCSPDHPYVKEHPEWFLHRPDGTIRYAENPPKKYQDIYPINFESEQADALWEELKSIFLHWAAEGVRIFRVDNPHTKPFAFWEWVIAEVKQAYPDVLFLAEAFTRPRVMYRLAKLGFTQSYTYFSWRNTKWELTQYLTELTRTEVKEFFRPNFWPNTPDILTEFLQYGGRPGFMLRLLLAATMTASYGIYGPAFELCEGRAREFGSEEYLDSEKYQIREWNLDHPDSLGAMLARVNRMRREHPALQANDNFEFHPIDNEQMICFSKRTDDGSDIVVVIANLDVYHQQSGWVELPLERFGLDPHQPYQAHDLLDNSRYLWHGARNFVTLDPHVVPGHIFAIRRRVRKESDFEYYL